MKQLLWAALTALLLGTTACQKNDPAPTSNRDLLVDKEWQLSSATVDPTFPTPNGGTTSNLYNLLKDCTKDDFEVYESDEDYLLDEGGTRCETNDPQNVKGSWVLNSDQTRLTVSAGGQTVSYKVLSISDREWEVETQEVSNGTTYTLTLTYRVR